MRPEEETTMWNNCKIMSLGSDCKETAIYQILRKNRLKKY